MMKANLLIILLATLWCAIASPSKAGSYVDDNDTEKLAELVCHTTKGTKSLIGHLSSLERLVKFLGGLSSEHQLFKCRNEYLISIEELVQVVRYAGHENACGEAKLAAIEDYHRKYISKVSKHLRKRKEYESSAPKMIRIFFMQYATEISSICEQNTLKFLDNNRHTIDSESLAKVEKLRKFTDSLGMTDLRKGYQGIYLFWNMVEALDLARRNEKLSKYVIPGTQSVNIQMKDAKPIVRLQVFCRYQLKPVYSKTLLPLLRLIDLGYYPHGSHLVDRLNGHPASRSLFFATQICETLLPIVAFSDDKLPKDGFVALTWAEASKLVQPQIKNADELTKEEPQVNLEPVILNKMPTFSDETAPEVIKANVASRSKIIQRMLRQLLRHTKSQLKSLFNGYKLFRREQHSLVALNDEAQRSWDQIEGELEMREEGEGGGLVRRKRDAISNFFMCLFSFTFVLLYAMVTVIVKTAICIVPFLILAPFALFGNEWSQDYIRWMFSMKWDD